MPTVNLNRKTFERLIGKHIEDDFLKDRISYLGTDLEKVDDDEIVVEIFPNRPDMLSEYGFARAMSTFLKTEKGLRHYEVRPSGEKVVVQNAVAKVRPYTVCAIVKNIKLDDEKIRELIQIQEKLHVSFCRQRKKAAIGIYPMEKIRFPITYTAKKPRQIVFQPLDYPKKINAAEILEKHPAGRAYGHLLKGSPVFPVFLDANNQVLSVPPIINSESTGRVTEKTREFFIECSGFDFVTLNQLLNILVTAFADMGGEIFSMKVEYGREKKAIVTPNLKPAEMRIDFAYINNWLGLGLTNEEIRYYLGMMGYGCRENVALVPAYRTDVLHTVDLAEDVAIAYGYERFREEIPKVATTAEESGLDKFTRKVAGIMVGMGLQELNTYHITNRRMQCGMMECQMDLIELENALTEDYNVLRAWLTPLLLQSLAENKTREFPQRVFDFGAIFKSDRENATETGVLEQVRLAALTSHSKADFSEAKGMLDYLMRMLGMQYELVPEDHPSFIPGRVGRIIVNGKKVAYIGEIHPKVLENFGIEMPVAGFEINLSEIFSLL
jgi:phenylalanyl-tRNA synthetase beta chain